METIERKQSDSPFRFIVTRVARHVKRKPIEAPIAHISTNQPRASRPRIGPESEMPMQNKSAFFGVLCLGSMTAKDLGRYPSLVIEYIRREEAI